jgi:hypothetical protein
VLALYEHPHSNNNCEMNAPLLSSSHAVSRSANSLVAQAASASTSALSKSTCLQTHLYTAAEFAAVIMPGPLYAANQALVLSHTANAGCQHLQGHKFNNPAALIAVPAVQNRSASTKSRLLSTSRFLLHCFAARRVRKVSCGCSCEAHNRVDD